MNQSPTHQTESSAKRSSENIRVTSIDVAKLAGVSQATVSRAFNPNSKMLASTREKVFEAARTLKYSPDAIARSLTSNSTNMIGVIMKDASNPFYAEILTTLSIELRKYGKQILFFHLDNPEKLQSLIHNVLQYRVDGIIITSISLTADLMDICIDYGLPVVLLNRYIQNPDIMAVCSDNIQAGRDCADFLFMKGYRQFGFVGSPDTSSTAHDRYLGFSTRLKERGIHDIKVYPCEYGYESGRTAMDQIMRNPDTPPEALFCSSDLIAAGIMDSAKYKYQLKIPEDLAVIGFDNIELSRYSPYNLTTFAPPIDELVHKSIELVLHPSSTRKNLYQYPCRLITRGSS